MLKILPMLAALVLMTSPAINAQNIISGPATWTPIGHTSTVTTDNQGTIAFSGIGGSAGAVLVTVLTGDFIFEYGAMPDNRNVPAQLMFARQGHEADGQGPYLFITRAAGFGNDALIVSDQINPLSNTADTDITFPARFFVVRLGTTIQVFRDHYEPNVSVPFYTATPSYQGPLTLTVAANNESAGIFEAKLTTGTLHQPLCETITVCELVILPNGEIGEMCFETENCPPPPCDICIFPGKTTGPEPIRPRLP